MPKQIKWKKEKRKVSDLKPADYNPRKMTEAEERDLADSIDEYGAVIPLVINTGKRENILIGGHQRTKLYEKKGIKEVDVMVPDRELTLEEEKKLNLRLNKNVGSWDPSKLKDLDLMMLLEVGFDDEDLQVFFDDVEMIEDEFSMPNPKDGVDAPKSRPGEIYQLGEHRLMCGDSTDPEQVKKLMGDDLADMVYSDPPYNIGLSYSKGLQNTRNKYGGKFKLDNKKDKDYALFLDYSIKNSLEHTKPNAHIFYWCDERYIWLLQGLYEENKIKNQRVCMWIKNNSFPTPQVAFNKVYEPCVYGILGKPYMNRSYNGLNEILNKEVRIGNQGFDDLLEIINLWIVKKDASQEYEHPTQKPVTLAEKPLKRCTAPGHIIIDLFGGSGSTMIAAEQLGRHVRMMEMDPVFCDAIIKRWEEFTNKKAKKI